MFTLESNFGFIVFKQPISFWFKIRTSAAIITVIRTLFLQFFPHNTFYGIARLLEIHKKTITAANTWHVDIQKYCSAYLDDRNKSG